MIILNVINSDAIEGERTVSPKRVWIIFAVCLRVAFGLSPDPFIRAEFRVNSAVANDDVATAAV